MIEQTASGPVTYYIRTDHIGRPVFATDDTGAKVWEVSYLPFGGVHTEVGAPIGLVRATNDPPDRLLTRSPPANGSRPKAACTRTGCATTTPPPAATSRRTRWGWWMGRVCMVTPARTRAGMWTQAESLFSLLGCVCEAGYVGLQLERLSGLLWAISPTMMSASLLRRPPRRRWREPLLQGGPIGGVPHVREGAVLEPGEMAQALIGTALATAVAQ